MSSSKLRLEALGWDAFFKDNFAPFLEQALFPGRITEVQRRSSIALTEGGELDVSMSRKYDPESGPYPVVGDWVAIEPGSKEFTGLIRAVLPRKNKFSRKAAGKDLKEQVMAANVDYVWIVTDLDKDFKVPRIERYLTLVSESGSKPVVILNKSDVSKDLEGKTEELKRLDPSIPVHIMSAELGEGLAALKQYMVKGKTITILGSSGVGKSTIINRILGKERQDTWPIREKDGRGRHVTTYRELIMIPKGGMIIDNPGMREIQLWTDGTGIAEVFEDIEALARSCKFSDCRHRTEPGCAVKKALESGELDTSRFEHYLKLSTEVEFLIIKQKKMLRRNEKAKWKNIKKWGKEIHAKKTGKI